MKKQTLTKTLYFSDKQNRPIKIEPFDPNIHPESFRSKQQAENQKQYQTNKQQAYAGYQYQIQRDRSYWGQQYARYAASVSRSKQRYSERIVATLKNLAQKAHAEQMASYTGWQKYYREHPLTHKKKQAEQKARLIKLKKLNTERTNALTAQLKELKTQKNNAVEQAWKNAQWLNQTQEERAKNTMTDRVVEAEIGTMVAQQSAKEINNEIKASQLAFDSNQAKLATNNSTHSNTNPLSLDVDAMISGVVNTMRYYSTPEAQAKIDAQNNNQSAARGISKNNSHHYAGGSYNASRQIARSQKGPQNNLVKATPYQIGHTPTDPEKVELINPYVPLVANTTTTQSTNPTIAPIPALSAKAAIREKILNIGKVETKQKILVKKLAKIDRLELFGESFISALQETFPGATVGESIQSFLLNIGKAKEVEIFKANLIKKYPTQKNTIESLTVDALLVKYPSAKDFAVDLGWVTFDLAGGHIIKFLGKTIVYANKGLVRWERKVFEKLKKEVGSIQEGFSVLWNKFTKQPQWATVSDKGAGIVKNTEKLFSKFGDNFEALKQSFSQFSGKGGNWNGTFTKNGNPISFEISKAKGTVVTDLGNEIKISTTNKFRSIIHLTKNSEILDIKEVFRNNSANFKDLKMSNVVLDQIDFVKGDVSKLKQIKLSVVVNDELLLAIKTQGPKYVSENFGKFGGLDGMVRNLTDKIGKTFDTIEISNFVPKGATKYDPHYNIIINLK